MPAITTNDLKTGITLQLDNGLFQVVEFQHVKPGKGGAFVRTKLRNVKSNSKNRRKVGGSSTMRRDSSASSACWRAPVVSTCGATRSMMLSTSGIPLCTCMTPVSWSWEKPPSVAESFISSFARGTVLLVAP